MDLLNDWEQNCKLSKELSMKTICDLELPLFNTISALEPKNIIKLIDRVCDKVNLFDLNQHEYSVLLMTLLDVVTCFLKEKAFYLHETGPNLSRCYKKLCLHVKEVTVSNAKQKTALQAILQRCMFRLPDGELKDDLKHIITICAEKIVVNESDNNYVLVPKTQLPPQEVDFAKHYVKAPKAESKIKEMPVPRKVLKSNENVMLAKNAFELMMQSSKTIYCSQKPRIKFN